jgi:hypothetical protein
MIMENTHTGVRSGLAVRLYGQAPRACPVDHGTGSRSQMLIEATSMVPW